MADIVTKQETIREVDTPTDPHDNLLTQDQVEAALKADLGPSVRLVKYVTRNLTNAGDNYGSIMASVEIEYKSESEGERTLRTFYVAKINPGKNGIFTELFQKEAKVYRAFISDANYALREIGERELNFPKHIYSDTKEGKEVIFLENLRTRGFRMYDKRKGLDTAHANLVLKELARLHAASVLVHHKNHHRNLTDKYEFLKTNWSYVLSKPEIKQLIETKINSYKGYTCRFEKNARVTRWLEDITTNLRDVFEEQLESGMCKVVCHGDTWSNNFLFRYDEDNEPEEVMLLDLQMSTYSSPLCDLNYLLHTSLTKELMRPNLNTFLSTYHASFRGLLEGLPITIPFTLEELERDFDSKSVYGAAITMFILPLVYLNPVTAMKMDISEWCEHEEFRHRILSLFEDLMDVGVIP